MTINKNKIILIFLAIMSLLTASSFYLFKKWRSSVEDVKRWQDNYIEQSDSLAFIRTKSGENAAIAKQLYFENKELKKLKKSGDSVTKKLYAIIDDLGLKLKNVNTVLFNTIQTQGEGYAVKSDPKRSAMIGYETYINDTTGCNFYIFDDGFLYAEILGCSDDSSEVRYTNTLRQGIVTDVFKKPIDKFWKKIPPIRWFGREWTGRTIVSVENPHSKVISSTQINIKKKF